MATVTDTDDKLAALADLLSEQRNAGLVGFSDDALALRFTEKHGGTLRYVAEWHRWYRWLGTHWQPDRTLLAFDLARDLCRAAAKGANSGGKGLASSTTVNAVVSLARTDRRHAATTEQWDTDPWLLNTPGCTILLKTGESRAHAIGDGHEVSCERWTHDDWLSAQRTSRLWETKS